MSNGEKIIMLLNPRDDQVRISGEYIEIEIQHFGINFSCTITWWNAESKEGE